MGILSVCVCVCVCVKRECVATIKERVCRKIKIKKYSKENVKHTVNFSVILLIFVDIIFLLLLYIVYKVCVDLIRCLVV